MSAIYVICTCNINFRFTKKYQINRISFGTELIRDEFIETRVLKIN